MILCLRVAEDQQKRDESGEDSREPEEATPAMMTTNGASHDRSEKGSGEVKREIRCHPCSSLVEEEHIGNCLNHDGFTCRSNDTIACASC